MAVSFFIVHTITLKVMPNNIVLSVIIVIVRGVAIVMSLNDVIVFGRVDGP